MKKILIASGTLLTVVVLTIIWGRSGEAPSREGLVENYPSVGIKSDRPENKKILCPFLRTVERAGLLDAYKSVKSYKTPMFQLIKAAQTFGCGMLECGAVAAKVSKGQKRTLGQDFGYISLEKLHKAEGVSHECGFTFAKGGTQVSDRVRANTFSRLVAKSNDKGQLSYQDLLETKMEICQAQNVEISDPGRVEVKLIFAYLGGVERGYVDLDDVKRLFHAEMPKYKTARWIRFDLFKELDQKFTSK